VTKDEGREDGSGKQERGGKGTNNRGSGGDMREGEEGKGRARWLK